MGTQFTVAPERSACAGSSENGPKATGSSSMAPRYIGFGSFRHLFGGASIPRTDRPPDCPPAEDRRFTRPVRSGRDEDGHSVFRNQSAGPRRNRDKSRKRATEIDEDAYYRRHAPSEGQACEDRNRRRACGRRVAPQPRARRWANQGQTRPGLRIVASGASRLATSSRRRSSFGLSALVSGHLHRYNPAFRAARLINGHAVAAPKLQPDQAENGGFPPPAARRAKCPR